MRSQRPQGREVRERKRNGEGLTSFLFFLRLNWGGHQASEYLLKLAQLKYPNFPVRVTSSQAQWLLETQTYVSTDYRSELDDCSLPDRLAMRDKVIQFPYTEAVVNVKTEEEIKKATERKKESGRRLQEQASKVREEKVSKR